MQGIRGPGPSRLFPITITVSGLSPDDRNEQLPPGVLNELGSRQEPTLREVAGLEVASVWGAARLPDVGREVSGCGRRLLSWLRGSRTGPSSRRLTFWVLEPRPGSPGGRTPWKGKLGELFIWGEFCWLLLLPPVLVPVLKLRVRLRVFSELGAGNPLQGGRRRSAWARQQGPGGCSLQFHLVLLGGVRVPLFLVSPRLRLLRPRLLRTCLSIQARRLVRLLCSDSTMRGHGLHSAMSRAAMAIARPTCSKSSTVYLEGKAGGGGGLARPLSWQAAGMLFTDRPVL